jgi:hypothetical protein
MIDFLTDLQNKYNKYTIYVHNLSNFDCVYLLKSLCKLFNANTLLKDGKIISLQMSNKKKVKVIILMLILKIIKLILK